MHKLDLKPERVAELEQKIARSKEIFEMAFKRFAGKDMRIIWSGGKDSTLTLWICLQFCKQNNRPCPKVLTIDEGDSFEEIDDFLNSCSEKWNIELDWGRNDDVLSAAGHQLNSDVVVADLNARNQKEIQRLGFDLERFPFEAESYVGNHLMKTVVLNTYLEDNRVKAVFQGIRWDEHSARSNDAYVEDVPADDLVPAHTRYRPILHFSERDIWDTTRYFDIPFCKLYDEGYRSLGAKSTSQKLSDTPAWQQDLEDTQERAGRRQDKEKTMARLRMLGYL